MSGPKIIDYQARERRLAEAARRRWQALCGRAEALNQRCAESGHPECTVDVGHATGSSEDIERRCGELERALADAARQLEGRQFDDRTKEVVANLHDVLADLERREQAEANAAARPADRSAPEPARRVDYTRKVADLLASLRVPSAGVDDDAHAVLAAVDPARARLLYDHLKERISEINRAAEAIIEQRAELAELRAQVDGLPDPGPVDALLGHAARALDQGDDVQAHLKQARAAITHQQDAAAAESDREFVRQAIAESLTEIGYDVADVDVETSETLVFRQNATHGIRAEVRDGEIDIRTVRLGAQADSGADRDAEDKFCETMPALLAAMSSRGISAAIKEQKLPGLITPPTVAVRKKKAKQRAQQQRPAVRERGAR